MQHRNAFATAAAAASDPLADYAAFDRMHSEWASTPQVPSMVRVRPSASSAFHAYREPADTSRAATAADPSPPPPPPPPPPPARYVDFTPSGIAFTVQQPLAKDKTPQRSEMKYDESWIPAPTQLPANFNFQVPSRLDAPPPPPPPSQPPAPKKRTDEEEAVNQKRIKDHQEALDQLRELTMNEYSKKSSRMRNLHKLEVTYSDLPGMAFHVWFQWDATARPFTSTFTMANAIPLSKNVKVWFSGRKTPASSAMMITPAEWRTFCNGMKRGANLVRDLVVKEAMFYEDRDGRGLERLEYERGSSSVRHCRFDSLMRDREERSTSRSILSVRRTDRKGARPTAEAALGVDFEQSAHAGIAALSGPAPPTAAAAAAAPTVMQSDF